MSEPVVLPYDAVYDRKFWSSIAPDLGLEKKFDIEAKLLDAEDGLIAQQRAQFILDGYFSLPGLFKKKDIRRLRKAAAKIVDIGLPPVFIFVFDEPWLLFARAQRIIGAVFEPDFRVLGNFWAWHVPNSPQESGFRPHRDFYDRCLLDNGMPGAASLWVALSDARPPNSCLYFLPASQDPNYPGNLRDIQIPDLRSIRAAPAAAGTVIGVGANVLHWGARGSALSPQPRISLAVEVISSSLRNREAGAWTPDEIPSFDARLKLIGNQILMFHHHYDMDPTFLSFARFLRGGR